MLITALLFPYLIVQVRVFHLWGCLLGKSVNILWENIPITQNPSEGELGPPRLSLAQLSGALICSIPGLGPKSDVPPFPSTLLTQTSSGHKCVFTQFSGNYPATKERAPKQTDRIGRAGTH